MTYPDKVKVIMDNIIKKFDFHNIKLGPVKQDEGYFYYIFHNSENTQITVFYHGERPYMSIECLRREAAYLDSLYIKGIKINGPALRRLGLR